MNQQEHEFVKLLQDYGKLHSKHLEEFLGVNDVKIREIRAKLQEDGIMVCSNVTGYWLTDNATEWYDNMYQNLGGRAKKMFYTMHRGVRRRILQEMNELEFSNTTI